MNLHSSGKDKIGGNSIQTEFRLTNSNRTLYPTNLLTKDNKI